MTHGPSVHLDPSVGLGMVLLLLGLLLFTFAEDPDLDMDMRILGCVFIATGMGVLNW